MMTSAEEEAIAWFVALISAPDINALWPQFRVWRDASPENARAFRAYELLWEMFDFVAEQPPGSTLSNEVA